MTTSIYLDNNATTPVDSRVVAAMLPWLAGAFGNPSSIHAAGQRARGALEAAREETAASLGCSPREIVFTSGGTEADHLAVQGAFLSRGATGLVAIGATEHPAVVAAARALEARGAAVRILPVDENGVVSLDALDTALAEGARLVSVMWANNETGVLAPLEAIAARCRAAGALFHCDAVQAAGKVVIDLRQVTIDLLSISAHKFHGPKGAGALFVRRGVALAAQQPGGHQERGWRGGTENVAGAVGLGRALSLALAELPEADSRQLAFRQRFIKAALAAGGHLNGANAARLSNTLSVSWAGLSGEALVIALDLAGIATSSGSACAAGSTEPSPVLAAMGVAPALAKGALRISLSRMTTEEEVVLTEQVLPEVVARLQAPGRKSPA